MVYEALHTTVMGPAGRWVEIQVRSARMNEIAEKGLAAHWKYKEGGQQESKLDDFLQHLRDTLTNSENEDTLDFLQDIKLDLFMDEIYIYTPRGDMRVLPKGATMLDFAFDIHSKLGLKMHWCQSKSPPCGHVAPLKKWRSGRDYYFSKTKAYRGMAGFCDYRQSQEQD